jgi:4-amino-4-deoxy-L-arabinose transferase-like glycosyltransferase
MSSVRITTAREPFAGVVDRTAIIWGMVLLLTAIGAYLRLTNIGALSFRWDEDLSSLAVKAILETGVPELPSGMMYLRGGAFLYMMAASAQLFGFSEFSMRLPAAVFGIAMIPLVFVFARTLFGTRVGLVTAALLTISVWDIEFSRYARMYSPFAFFYIATLLCVFRYRVHSESARGGVLCVLLALAAISLHDLGYTLAIAFFVPLMIRRCSSPRELLDVRRLAFPLVSGAIVAAFFFLWSGLLDRLRKLPIAAASDGMADAAAAVPESTAAPFGILLREVPMLVGLAQAAPALLAVLAAGLLAAAAWFASARLQRPIERVVLVAIAACCALQLFNFALLAAVVLAFLKREGLGAFRRPGPLFAIGLIAIAFFAWLGAAMILGLAVSETSQGMASELKTTVRTLLDYPHFFVFWGFPNEMPLLCIPAAVGALWAFDRAARPNPHGAALFLILAFLTPMICNGLFSTAYQIFRYNVPFNALLFTFVALGLTQWREVAAYVRAPRIGGARADYAAAGAWGTALLVACVLAFDLNPLRGWLATQRDYLEEASLYRVFGMRRYADFATPASYLATNAASDDTILALEPREYYNYLGRLDYSVMSNSYEPETYDDAGTRRDLYIDTPLIMDLATLREVLNAPGKTKWLIASDTMIAGTRYLNDEMRSFLQSQREHAVYVGRDGVTQVYRFD